MTLFLALAGCYRPFGPTCEVTQTTNVSLQLRSSDPATRDVYAALSVLAVQDGKTDTVRTSLESPTGYNLVGYRNLGKQDSVRIRALWGDSVVFERLYATRDTLKSHRFLFRSDTTGCESEARESFELPGGYPVTVCFNSETLVCID